VFPARAAASSDTLTWPLQVLVVIQYALVMESLVLGTGKDPDLVPSVHVRPMMNVRFFRNSTVIY